VDGRVISFGKRSHLGRENGSSSLEPVKIDEPVSYISTGYNHSMVIARKSALAIHHGYLITHLFFLVQEAELFTRGEAAETGNWVIWLRTRRNIL
jgi:hypothetical protein